MQRYERPYLDADAWIHALDGTDEGVEVIRPNLAAVDAGRLILIVSAIMPVELLGGVADARTRGLEDRALAALSRPNVREVQVGRAVVMLARTLRIDYGLRSMDALHLASAARGGADVYLSYDERALRVERFRDIAISKPYWYGDVPLPMPAGD